MRKLLHQRRYGRNPGERWQGPGGAIAEETCRYNQIDMDCDSITGYRVSEKGSPPRLWEGMWFLFTWVIREWGGGVCPVPRGGMVLFETFLRHPRGDIQGTAVQMPLEHEGDCLCPLGQATASRRLLHAPG